jgi:SNF family Na+-dependent transporter
MTIGAGIFVAAVGAILRFAVNDRFDDVDLAVVGNILMIAGAVGLIIGLILTMQRRRVVTEVHDGSRRR